MAMECDICAMIYSDGIFSSSFSFWFFEQKCTRQFMSLRQFMSPTRNLSIARRSENSHPLFYHQINDVVDGINFQHLSELTYRTNDSMISRHASHKFIFFLFMHVVLKLNRFIFHARVRAFVDTRYKIEYNYPGSSISTIVQKPFPSSTKAPQS